MRGRLPKPTGLRKLEGNPGHRSFPKNEPQYGPGLPQKPRGMSVAAKKIWDELVDQMLGAAILRNVDQRALRQLCEDEAILEQAYESFWKMARRLKKEAEAQGKELPAGEMMALLTMKSGRLAMNSLRDLAARVIIERREFGLTPSSRTRVASDMRNNAQDVLDDAIFNRGAEMLILPKPN